MRERPGWETITGTEPAPPGAHWESFFLCCSNPPRKAQHTPTLSRRTCSKSSCPDHYPGTNGLAHSPYHPFSQKERNYVKPQLAPLRATEGSVPLDAITAHALGTHPAPRPSPDCPTCHGRELPRTLRAARPHLRNQHHPMQPGLTVRPSQSLEQCLRVFQRLHEVP